MNRILHVLLVLAVITACTGNPASETAGPQSASTNAPGCEWPKVNPDLSVVFRIEAPDADKVAVDICGETDPRITYTQAAVEAMREKGAEIHFSSFPGGHEWQPWRKSIHEFAQLVFKNN